MTFLCRRAVAGALLLAGLAGGAAAAAAAARPPDPFYLGLLREGRDALARGRYQPAAETLRLACFGLLDDPKLLAECLVRLALAQAGAGDHDAFSQTFERLVEVEGRFQGYSAAAISSGERAAFEDRVLQWLPASQVAGLPGLETALTRKQEADLAQMTPADRRKELERLAGQNPGDPRWRLQLAELELQADRPAKAAEWLQNLPADGSGGRVGCLRGQALAALERCGEAGPLLAACPAVVSEARYTRAQLGCLAAAKQWPQMLELRSRLSPAVAADSGVTRLLDQAVKEAAKAAAPGPVTAKPPAQGPAPAATGSRSQGEAPPAPTAAAGPSPARRVTGSTVAAQAPADVAPAKPVTTTPAPVPIPTTPAEAVPTRPAPVEVRTPAQPPLADEDRAALEQAQGILRTARTAKDLERALELARPVADRFPEAREAQQLVGAIAYRSSQWDVAVAYLQRGGEPGSGQPELAFYLAVALYETGRRAEAAQALRSVEGKLERTPYVESYLKKILGP